MDPDVALLSAADAMADRDLGTVFDQLDHLRGWTATGGFAPSVDASREWTTAVGAWETDTGLSWTDVDREASR